MDHLAMIKQHYYISKIIVTIGKWVFYPLLGETLDL